MAIDTGGGMTIESTPRSWPKCAQCSERLNTDYPVEKFGIESRVKDPLLLGGYRLTVLGECHGERMHADIEIPAWASKTDANGELIPSAIEIQQIGKLRFFQRSGTGLIGKVAIDLPRRIG